MRVTRPPGEDRGAEALYSTLNIYSCHESVPHVGM